MAQYARRLLQTGARIVGGCCGGLTEHIGRLPAEARSLQPAQRTSTASAIEEAPKAGATTAGAMAKIPVAAKSGLGAKLAAGKFVTFVEILPPRGVDACKEIEGARLCRDAPGSIASTSPDGPRASARLSARDLPAVSAARRDRGGAPFLLPRPHYSASRANFSGGSLQAFAI